MSRPYRTPQQYLDSGRIPFTFCDERFKSLGPVTVYNFKRKPAHKEYKRQAQRLLRQKQAIKELEAEVRKMLDQYRRKVIGEKRKIESALGLIPLNERSLFDDKPEALNDGELNIIPIRAESKSEEKQPQNKVRRRPKPVQTMIDFDLT